MIRMLNACTAEIDDSEAAVAEILEQLDIKKQLLPNSVGIIACYSEFIETGVVEALCKSLPFDVVGCTTLGNSACGKYGMDILSLSVLTSDDIRFVTLMSGPISEKNLDSPISSAYNSACQEKKPDFILAYAPLMRTLGGSVIFNALNAVSGGIPMFGTFSCDHTLNFSESQVIRNGKTARDTMALILMFGNVDPKFYVTAIPEKNIMRHSFIVTESEGVILKRVNGMPLMDYLGTLGLAQKGGIEAIGSIPLLINYNDGTEPVALAIYGITPEGYAVCGGDVPVKATLSIGSLDYHGILETAETTIRKIPAGAEINGLLIYPCLSRNMMLGPNADDEMKKVIELLGGKYPYQICYAGGEICPFLDEGGKPVNHFHNFSFILCVL
ncbi:MAG: FIST C-terminal domain-containing protein [Spirochaetales bacterium]|jgi:hypothetical protein|nr:FIST C-terminal domain-containing protein [Spirochaetales bacterium]